MKNIMTTDKATYSRKAVRECIAEINALNMTVSRKKDHGPRLSEVKIAYDSCFKKTKCCVFSTYYGCTPLSKYLKAYDRDAPKKDLDGLLKESVIYLQDHINAIQASIDYGKVNTID